MSTKNHPGKFDCYAAADPDEEMFVLLGRDPMAGLLVRAWAMLRERRGEDPAKVKEARDCADKLDAWAAKKGKNPLSLRPTGDEDMPDRGDLLDAISDAMEDVEDFHDDSLRAILALAQRP